MILLQSILHPYKMSHKPNVIAQSATVYIKLRSVLFCKFESKLKVIKQVLLFASFNILQVGLKFLHDCNIIHNNMFIGSVLVTKSGVWRIGGFEYVISSYNDPMPTRYISSNIKYLPPEFSGSKIRNNLNIW